jgi:hypothetical protein
VIERLYAVVPVSDDGFLVDTSQASRGVAEILRVDGATGTVDVLSSTPDPSGRGAIENLWNPLDDGLLMLAGPATKTLGDALAAGESVGIYTVEDQYEPGIFPL